MTVSYTPAEAKVALLAVMTTALTSLNVTPLYAWNPSVTEKSAFLGRPVFDGDEWSSRTPVTSTPKFAETVRPADATFAIEGTCWSFRPDLTPDAAQTVEAEVDALWSVLEPSFAALDWVSGQTCEYQLRPFEKGWAGYVPFTVQVLSLLS